MAAIAAKPDAAPRVLLVEDDRSICDVIAELLSDLGFETVCVHTDRQAYDALPTLPTFSALVVDVNLGAGTTGFDVARFARQVLPEVAVIYISGQASPDSFRAFGVRDSAFLLKPFEPQELVAAVRARIPANR